MREKIFSTVLAVLMILSAAAVIEADENNDESYSDNLQQTFSLEVSHPIINDNGEFIEVDLLERESLLLETGKPVIPVVIKTFTFPFGTVINNVEIDIKTNELSLPKKIQPSPSPVVLSIEPVTREEDDILIDNEIYSSTEPYPSEPYDINTGAGLDDDEHVIFLNVRCYSQYIPAQDIIIVPDEVNIVIDYNLPQTTYFNADEYDMVIITHEKFEEDLQPLVAHKNSIGMRTTMVTVDEIYPEYDGRFEAEDIKLFIKDAIEDWGVKYVLLAGGKVGQTHEWYVPDFESHNFDGAYSDGGIKYDPTYSCDLYYADIYVNPNYPQFFSDWDTNQNGVFGEGPYLSDSDRPDFHPDVYLGRIPFRYSWEVPIVVNKIIDYENNADDSWFKKAVLIAGDTSPPARAPTAKIGVYEGELTTDVTASYLEQKDFEIEKLYTSTGTFTDVDSVMNAISEGCGLVEFQGHGNPSSWGNFLPDATAEAEFAPGFAILNIRQATNANQLPVMLLDGCHNCQFNVTSQQIIDFGGLDFPRAGLNEWIPTDGGTWFLHSEKGGAIGVIGNTALGYGYVNEYTTEGLGGWIMSRFAHAYVFQGKQYLGSMWAQGVNDYINTFDVMNGEVDRKTIEERALLGDPSLKLGGIGAHQINDENDQNFFDIAGEIETPTNAETVPIWNKGQSWTYKLDNIDFQLSEVEGRSIDLSLSTGNLELEVTEVNSDSYTTEFVANDLNLDIDVYFDFFTADQEPIDLEFSISGIDLTGEIIFEKNTLGIESIKGILNLELFELLEYLPFELPQIVKTLQSYISIPVEINLNVDFKDPYELFDFPINIGDSWALPSGNITFSIDGEVRSIWLRVLDVLNRIASLFGMDLIPPDLAKYLPVIDISEVLEDLGIPSSFSMDLPEIDNMFREPLFESSKMKNIQVQAGTYNAMSIDILGGVGEILYSSDAENAVKITGRISDFIPTIEDINLELISIQK